MTALNAGSMSWDLISGIWNLNSNDCPLDQNLDSSEIEFASLGPHPAAKISFRGHMKDEGPSLNMIYIGGIGNRFECNLNRAYVLSKMQYDGLRYANVFTVDHMGFTDITELIESVVSWVKKLEEEYAKVPIMLVGYSFGTGIMVQVATRVSVEGLFLMNAYEHPSDLVERIQLRNLADIFVGYPLDSNQGLLKIQKKGTQKVQLYIFASEEDRVIYPIHGKNLYEAALHNQNINAHFFTHQGDHSDIFHETVMYTLYEDFNRHTLHQ